MLRWPKEIILAGNPEHIAQGLSKIVLFGKIKYDYLTTLDLNKCPEQIRYPRSLHLFAPIPELPSNVP